MKLPRIELKTISCKGIGSLGLFQRPSLSVAVALVTDHADGGHKHHRRRQVKETPINRNDGENPEWECPMLFDLGDAEMDYLLEFELTAHWVLLLGNRIVGRVRVPVAELAEEARIAGPFSFRFVTYQVLTADGKPNGTLSFGFRMIDPNLVAPPPHPPAIGHHLTPAPTDPPAYYFPTPTPKSPPYPSYSYLSADSSPSPSLYSHLSPELSNSPSLYPRLSPELSNSPSLYPRLSPEPSPPSSLFSRMPPEPTTHLYPPLSPREQTSSFYPPPPDTEGGLQYYNHYSNIYPPPPVRAYSGCYQSENQPYGYRMDAYDRRLYG